jgi:hypothetical protein
MLNRIAGKALMALALAASQACLLADEKGVLTIGSKAPSLDVEHWVSDGNGAFKPVTAFQPGKVYVVEFWATDVVAVELLPVVIAPAVVVVVVLIKTSNALTVNNQYANWITVRSQAF